MSKKYKVFDFSSKTKATDMYDEKNKHIDRQKELGFMNPETNQSVSLKQDGEAIFSFDFFNQEKYIDDKNFSIAKEKNEVCNRKYLEVDDYIINHQKLNQQLIRLSDANILFDQEDTYIGALNVSGTVLVKAWEPYLQRYVYIRRAIRTPLFSTELTEALVPDEYKLDLSNVNSLDTNLAKEIRQKRIKQNLATEEMVIAEGGSNYDQGDYNNYDNFLNNEDPAQDIIHASNNPYLGTITKGEIINKSVTEHCWPCPNAKIVTAKIGDGRNHDGWDISESDAFNKNIKICASKAGKVEVSNQVDGTPGNWHGYGGCVVINHGDGTKTLYAHMKNNSVVVEVDQVVAQGEVLGIMGNTGKVFKSAGGTGTHLHYSIYRYNSKGEKLGFIDPATYLNPYR